MLAQTVLEIVRYCAQLQHQVRDLQRAQEEHARDCNFMSCRHIQRPDLTIISPVARSSTRSLTLGIGIDKINTNREISNQTSIVNRQGSNRDLRSVKTSEYDEARYISS